MPEFKPLTLEETFTKSAQSRQQAQKTALDTLGQISEYDKQFSQVLGSLDKQQADVFERTDETFKNLETIGKMEGIVPPAIINVIGMFKPELDPDVQRAQLDRRQLELGRIETQRQQAQVLHGMRVQTAQLTQETAVLSAEFDRQGYMDTQSKIRLGMDIKQQVRQEQFDRINMASTSELNQWLTDPSSMPADLRPMTGLAQEAFMRRQGAALGLAAGEFDLKTAIRTEEERQILNEIDNAGHAQLARWNKAPLKMPKHLQAYKGQIETRLNARENDALALAEGRFAFETAKGEKVQKGIIDEINNVETAKLEGYLINPTTIPAKLKGYEGLIQEVYNRRRVQIAQTLMTTTQASEMTRSLQLRHLEVPDFEKILAGDMPLPEGFTREEIELAMNMKKDELMDAKMSLLANEAGDLEVQDHLRTRWLQRKQLHEVQAILQSMEDDGVEETIIDGKMFTKTEINNAVLEKAGVRRAQVNEQVSQSLAAAGTNSEIFAAQESVEAISRTASPGVDLSEDPFAGMPRPFRDKARIAHEKAISAAQLGAIETSQAHIKVLNEQIDAARKATIDRTPKESKAATQEFMENQIVTNDQAAISYVADNALNPFLLQNQPFYSDAWNGFATALMDELGVSGDPSVGEVDPEEKSIAISALLASLNKNDPAANAIVETAVRKSHAREVAGGMMYQTALADAVEGLRETADEVARRGGAQGVPTNIWDRLYDPQTGKFNPESYNKFEQGGLVVDQFDPNKFARVVSQMNAELQVSGALPPGTNLGDILAARMRNRLMEFNNLGREDVPSAVFTRILFNNNAPAHIGQYIAHLQASATTLGPEEERAFRSATAVQQGAEQLGFPSVEQYRASPLGKFLESVRGDAGR